MRDPSTFEARLADAFEAYAVGAPVAVDSRALAAELAGRRRAGRGATLLRWPASRVWRLALVAAILALAAVAGLLAAGAWRRPPVPIGDSRLLVWLPSGEGEGTATLLTGDGTVVASRAMAAVGCPRLITGLDAIAVPGSGGLSLATIDGRPVTDSPLARLDTSYTGFERWAPDRRSVALVDTEGGPTTVVHFGPPSGTTRYGLDGSLAGALDAVFSEDGGRLVVAVRRAARSVVDIHLLTDGTDRLVNSITVFRDEPVQLAISPNGSRLAVALGAENRTALRRPRVMLVSLGDGTMQDGRVTIDSSIPIQLVSWSPDGRTLAVRVGDSGLILLEAETLTWTDTGAYFHDRVFDSRWSTEGGAPAIAMLEAAGHMKVYAASPAAFNGYRRLAGTASAFSPDGSLVGSIGALADRPVERGDAATIWAVDTWSGGDPWELATLPPATSGVLDPDRIPCIDWLPGGGS